MDEIGMVIIGHRSSKSTFGANNGEGKEGKDLFGGGDEEWVGKKENICRRKIFFVEEKKMRRKIFREGNFLWRKEIFVE